ncbi:MAG: histidinol-phosphate transaminase [Dehalococcoidia bacterium]|nr:histidinol-phosphate transaminase [Dehalococcoidia bacterium]
MVLRPRPEIEALEICPHGGPDYAELGRLGIKPEEVLDFSVSANPFGPSPGIAQALTSVAIDRYPDSESAELKSALAESIGISAKNIIIGSGSMELIRLIALAYFGSDDDVLIIEPTFGEYEVACRIAGSKVIKHRSSAEEDFRLNLNEVAELLRSHRPKGLFLCNPNNPTGLYLTRPEVEEICSACENTLLILDEAYIAFAENPWRSQELIGRGNVIILRSMTKDYALAGLRLGYAIASAEIIRALRKVCLPWNVNAMAQSAGIMALRDSVHLQSSLEETRLIHAFLREELSQLGLSPLPSGAHFFLVRVGDAKQFRERLLRYGIMVRDCASFGLPEYVRISPRPLPDCRRLIAAIGEMWK